MSRTVAPQQKSLALQGALEFPEELSSAAGTSANGVLPANAVPRKSVALRVSRDEMNLAEFPLAVLSTRVNTEVKTLEFKDTIRLKNGELVEREWIITGADKFGLPTSTDDDVILGLMCLSMEQGFRERKVYFSRYELLKILQWSTEGRSYSRLSKSLDRLSGVRIRSSNAFFDNSAKGFQTCNFGLIDAYEICDKRGTGEKSYFIWSEMMFDSFNSGFIKKLDLDFYFSLKSAVSRRLYRYLDKHFYHRGTVEKPLLTLAFEKLGLSRSYQYVSSIKQQIEPAVEELIERGFLRGYEYEGRGATTIARFMQNPEFGQKAQKAPVIEASAVEVSPTTESPNKRVLEEKLQEHGLTLFQSKRLLQKKSESELGQVEATISKFEALKSSGGTKSLSNPVGFLYRAVQDADRFPVPAERVEKPRPAVASPTKSPVAEQRAALDKTLSAQADAALAALSSADRAALRVTVEGKLACLKGILDKHRFEEAVVGCMRDELKKGLRAGK